MSPFRAIQLWLVGGVLLLCWPALSQVQWVQRTDVGTPGKRIDPAMAYDTDRGVTVFFGGEYSDAGASTITYYNDTWEYDGVQWRKIAVPQPLPDPRSGHKIVYDSYHKEVVLFGGVNENGYFNDTWVYQSQGLGLGSWTRMPDQTNAPSPRAAHVMAYDERGFVIVMNGGTSGTLTDPPEDRPGDTFLWDGTSWQFFVEGGYPPVTRAAMAYDSRRGYVLRGGGTAYFGSSGNWTDTELNWLNYFPDLNPDVSFTTDGVGTNRQQFAMAYDSLRDVLVAFGGVGPSQPGGLYTEIKFWPTMYGSDGQLQTQAGYYAYNITNITTPPPRARLAMVYDTRRQVTVLFGGVSGDTRYDDTWELQVTDFWVDYSYNGLETGAFASPFHSFADAKAAAPPGSIIKFKAGTGIEPGTITANGLTLTAPNGPVTITGR